MFDKHYEFLNQVQAYVAKNPEVAPRVTEACSQGINEALSEARQRAADFEVMFTLVSARRFTRSIASVVLNKLTRWKGKTSLVHDEMIAELQGQYNLQPKDTD